VHDDRIVDLYRVARERERERERVVHADFDQIATIDVAPQQRLFVRREGVAESFEEALAGRMAELLSDGGRISAAFARDCWVPLGPLIASGWEDRLRREARALLDVAARRCDLTVRATGDTPRRLDLVGQAAIAAHGGLLPRLYASDATLALVAAVSGRAVTPCPYEPERFILSALSRPGDTHGWHWDDYPYALVLVLDAALPGTGGELEFVPGTVWNKNDPQVAAIVRRGPVRRASVRSGEAYLLRSDTTLHRVTEIGPRGVRRIAFAMAFADANDARAVTHETTERLYGSDAATSAATDASIQAKYSREPRKSTIAISGSS